MRSTVTELCQYCSTRMVRTTVLQPIWTLGLTVCEHLVWENLNSSPSSLFPNVDNGYYFPYSPRYRNRRDETAVSVLLKKDGEGSQVRRKDPVLLLPWWKEILGTIIFCIAATTYIVRKFFHPPTAYARVNKNSSTCTYTQMISCLLLCQINIKSHALFSIHLCSNVRSLRHNVKLTTSLNWMLQSPKKLSSQRHVLLNMFLGNWAYTLNFILMLILI